MPRVCWTAYQFGFSPSDRLATILNRRQVLAASLESAAVVVVPGYRGRTEWSVKTANRTSDHAGWACGIAAAARRRRNRLRPSAPTRASSAAWRINPLSVTSFRKKSFPRTRFSISLGDRTSRSIGNREPVAMRIRPRHPVRMSPVRHHDQEVHVRVSGRPAVSVRPEDDDPLGVKLFRNPIGKQDDVVGRDHRLILSHLGTATNGRARVKDARGLLESRGRLTVAEPIHSSEAQLAQAPLGQSIAPEPLNLFERRQQPVGHEERPFQRGNI